MEYTAALTKAWSQLAATAQEKNYSLHFLGDEYGLDLEKRSVLSLSCNVPAKAHSSILLLHYLIAKLNGLPELTGDWISFKELAGGQGYYPAFKRRVIDTIRRKYQDRPDALFDLGERFKTKRVQLADVSVTLEAFEQVPILITFWRGDEEFGPEVNVLFDKSISKVFCTEDIVVFAEIVAHSI